MSKPTGWLLISKRGRSFYPPIISLRCFCSGMGPGGAHRLSGPIEFEPWSTPPPAYPRRRVSRPEAGGGRLSLLPPARWLGPHFLPKNSPRSPLNCAPDSLIRGQRSWTTWPKEGMSVPKWWRWKGNRRSGGKWSTSGRRARISPGACSLMATPWNPCANLIPAPSDPKLTCNPKTLPDQGKQPDRPVVGPPA